MNLRSSLLLSTILLATQLHCVAAADDPHITFTYRAGEGQFVAPGSDTFSFIVRASDLSCPIGGWNVGFQYDSTVVDIVSFSTVPGMTFGVNLTAPPLTSDPIAPGPTAIRGFLSLDPTQTNIKLTSLDLFQVNWRLKTPPSDVTPVTVRGVVYENPPGTPFNVLLCPFEGPTLPNSYINTSIDFTLFPDGAITPTATPSPTPTPTPTFSPTPTATFTPTITPSGTPTLTATPTPSGTITPTTAPTGTETPVRTDTPSPSPSITPTLPTTPSPTSTPSPTPTPTDSPTATDTITPSPSLTPQTFTPEPTESPSPTPTPTVTFTPTFTATETPLPSSSPTDTGTPTKTTFPTATVSPSPTPVPDPYSFDFVPDEQGWTFQSPRPFVAPASHYGKDRGTLELTIANNSESFGFWESPLLRFIDSDSNASGLRRWSFVLNSDAPPRNVPTIRLRTSTEDFSRSDIAVITAEGTAAYSPQSDYRFYSLIAPEYDARARADFDIIGFDKTDETTATVALDQMISQVIGFDQDSTFTTVLSLDFTGANSHGWGMYSSDLIAAPVFSLREEGLAIIGTATRETFEPTIFGFWGANSGVLLKAGVLYRTRWEVESLASDGSDTLFPTFRTRVNDGTFMFARVTNLNREDRAKGGAPRRTIEMLFTAPPELDGSPLLLAFDYLFSDTADTDSTAGIALRSITVEELRP